MKSMLFDISEKIDEPIIDALREVNRVADALGISFFVVGAAARDIILKHCYGIEPRRMTRDIDLGVKVESWALFDRLMDSLIATKRFATTKDRQRLKFGELLVDIIPFGRIANGQYRISWPPEHEIIMSLVGFKEAYEHAIIVRLSSAPVLDIKIPSLPGLALMKLISWKEQYPKRKKDAHDLLLIMDKYEEAGIFERLYNEELELLQVENFDTRLSSIRLLGRHMALIADDHTSGIVMSILDAKAENVVLNNLTIDMLSGDIHREKQYDEIRVHIEKLGKGFIESTYSIRR